MLIDKPYDSSAVISFKTVFGEEIISRIESETATHYVLKKPLVLITTPNGGLGLAPAAFSIPGANSIMLNKHAVALHGLTDTDRAGQYMEKTTGLTIVKG